MKHVKLSEARQRTSELFDEVARGTTLVISPDTGAAAFDEAKREDARKAIQEIRELRKGAGKVTAEEILAWRDEGRRF